MKVILTGFMASGKTTVGQALAHQLACPYTDLDAVVTAAAGKSIPKIFAQDGEPAFRQLEHEQLQAVINHPGVLATGGGTPVQANNQSLLAHSTATIVLLEASPAVIAQRLRQQSGRPLGDQLDEHSIARLKQKRSAAYHRLADIVVDTNDLDVDAICQQILDQMKKD